MSKKNVVGIDLGTSFSSIARLDQYGRPEVLPNSEGELMTPSIVYFSEEGVIIGQEAAKSGSDDPERLIENSKRHLGTEFLGWEIDEVFYTPVDIGAYILGKLKGDAEEQIGPIDGAVLSVPVHFSIQQRELTIQAAKHAGIDVLGLVNEPVAAGLTYILGENGLAYASLADEQTILVYDLGGGTFDLSIVHYSEEGIDVKAAAGDMKLGGIDWNARLINIIAQSFWDKRGYDIRRDARMMRKLAENIESAKRSLSNPSKPWTNVSIRYEGYDEAFKITREEFEKTTADLVARTRELTEGLVKSAIGRWDLIQQVLPVGGATRMPMIREAIRLMCLKTMGEVFGIEPNYRLSPDLAIAQGAALYAGLLVGDGPEGSTWAQQTYLPKMVSARGLGMAVRNHEGDRVNHILIPANTALPASVSVGVETVKANQQRITLKIVEAESPEFRDEDVLLRCEINNLPGDLPEGSAFDVDLTYEPSGLLQVVAQHRDSGRIVTARLKRESAAIEAPEGPPAPEPTESEFPVHAGVKANNPATMPEVSARPEADFQPSPQGVAHHGTKFEPVPADAMTPAMESHSIFDDDVAGELLAIDHGIDPVLPRHPTEPKPVAQQSIKKADHVDGESALRPVVGETAAAAILHAEPTGDKPVAPPSAPSPPQSFALVDEPSIMLEMFEEESLLLEPVDEELDPIMVNEDFVNLDKTAESSPTKNKNAETPEPKKNQKPKRP